MPAAPVVPIKLLRCGVYRGVGGGGPGWSLCSSPEKSQRGPCELGEAALEGRVGPDTVQLCLGLGGLATDLLAWMAIARCPGVVRCIAPALGSGTSGTGETSAGAEGGGRPQGRKGVFPEPTGLALSSSCPPTELGWESLLLKSPGQRRLGTATLARSCACYQPQREHFQSWGNDGLAKPGCC